MDTKIAGFMSETYRDIKILKKIKNHIVSTIDKGMIISIISRILKIESWQDLA